MATLGTFIFLLFALVVGIKLASRRWTRNLTALVGVVLVVLYWRGIIPPLV